MAQRKANTSKAVMIGEQPSPLKVRGSTPARASQSFGVMLVRTIALVVLVVAPALAQEHNGHHEPGRPDLQNQVDAGVPPEESDGSASDSSVRHEHGTAATPSDGEQVDEHERMMKAMTGPLGVPLQQNASGTAWQPASTPMYGHMTLAGDWSLMLHYLVFGGLDGQGSARGATEWVSTNWLMGMAQHSLLGGQFTARAMFSLEPAILGSDGYPLLLQTGETSGGEPLVDRQHPHDLFMELALKYNRALTNTVALELYAAAAGEPALGPAGFPHRMSAYADPLAPLSHHWQDSTHILFGVLTAGLYTKHVKLEGSWFNGREPDEDRYDFDLRVPDSYSFRVSVNPTANWSGQVSYGFLKEPEFVLEPGESVRRLSASVTHNRRVGEGGNWATTFAWGQNRTEHGAPSNAFLLESNLLFGNNNLFGRAEYVVKSGHDFALEGPSEEDTFPVGALALGYIRDFGPWAGLVPGLGLRGAFNVVPSELEARYGTRFPLGGMVFVRLRPAEMMTGMNPH